MVVTANNHLKRDVVKKDNFYRIHQILPDRVSNRTNLEVVVFVLENKLKSMKNLYVVLLSGLEKGIKIYGKIKKDIERNVNPGTISKKEEISLKL